MLNRGTGRRKNAIARVRLQPGEGRVTRHLNWPDCQNARDLGGLPRPGGLTRSHVLVRSDYLGHLTAPGREALIAYGVTTVIDLRSASEVANKPNPFADGSGPAYVHRELIDDANMRQIGDSPDMFERYLTILDNRPQAFRAIFESVAAVDGGVLFHCYAGKDRTGLIAAMLLHLAGVSPGD